MAKLCVARQVRPLAVTQGGAAEFSAPEEMATLAAGQLLPGAGRPDRYLLLLENGQAAVIRREACSDGMPGRANGLSADLLLNRDGPVLLGGCCSLAR
ncbi:hypothetical protein ACUXV3_13920 [Roseobacteraceae bacterium NS-SX3]